MALASKSVVMNFVPSFLYGVAILPLGICILWYDILFGFYSQLIATKNKILLFLLVIVGQIKMQKMQDTMPLTYPQVYPQIQNKEAMSSSPTAPAPMPAIHQVVLGPENTITVCQFCHASIKTAVKFSTTSRTHMAAALWCLACCLCCVPYSADSCKNTDHYCPNCEKYLGTYEK